MAAGRLVRYHGDETPESSAAGCRMTDRPWWQEAVVYQIYPRSFNDSDGDGIGDLRGIIDQVEYIEALGIDAVWLSPIYRSPQYDNGYDVADYRAIDPLFGSMDTFDELQETLHDRDIRLIMDMVVNHSSSEHAWFEASRTDPDGPFGDFYVWREGDPDQPPNNWESAFGGPAWTYDDIRGAWYLHLFDVHQPDLNWENPEVRSAIIEVMGWWFEKGLDGYRMDAVNLLSKSEGLPDGDPNGEWVGQEHFINGPRLLEFLRMMSDEVFEGTDTMIVGEMPQLDVAEAHAFIGDGPFDLVFPFEHVDLDFGPGGRWDVRPIELSELKAVFDKWQRAMADSGWNTLFFENHDQPRSVSRFGDATRYRYESATALATILLGLRGTPFIYQGQEIGMTNRTFPSLQSVHDVDTIRNVQAKLDTGEISSYEEIRPVIEHRSRDNSRTPFQWDDSHAAGFTTGDPWIAVNPNYPEINVASEEERDASILDYYRELIALRSADQTLIDGQYELLAPAHEALYLFTRTTGTDQRLVAINLSGEMETIVLEQLQEDAEVLIGNYDASAAGGPELSLAPYEARIYRQSV